MNYSKSKLIHTLYGVVTALFILATAAAFILSCLNIYDHGGGSYSANTVLESFSRIALLVYLCLAFVLGGFFIDLIVPCERKKDSARSDAAFTYRHTAARASKFAADGDLAVIIAGERRLRRVHTVALICVTVICAAVFISYAANVDNFPRDSVNDAMIGAMAVLIPSFVIPFVYALILSSICKKSMQRETEHLKKVIKNGISKDVCEAKNVACKKLVLFVKEHKNSLLLVTKCVIFVLGVLFLMLGIFGGGFEDVLAKAKNICTECIGLG